VEILVGNLVEVKEVVQQLQCSEVVVVDILVVVEGNLEEDSLAVLDIPVAEGNLVLAHTPVVDILVVAFVAQQCLIVVAHEDQDLSHALLLVVVQVAVLLLVVVQMVVLLLGLRLAVPGCSCVSPSVLTLVSCHQESCDWHGFHKQ